MKYVVGFLRFWYDFIIGDDWRVAAVIALGLVVTALLSHGDIASWWVMPVAVVGALVGSLRRAVMRAQADRTDPAAGA